MPRHGALPGSCRRSCPQHHLQQSAPARGGTFTSCKLRSSELTSVWTRFGNWTDVAASPRGFTPGETRIAAATRPSQRVLVILMLLMYIARYSDPRLAMSSATCDRHLGMPEAGPRPACTAVTPTEVTKGAKRSSLLLSTHPPTPLPTESA